MEEVNINLETEEITFTIGDDGRVKVNDADAAADFLINKILAGAGIQATVQTGANGAKTITFSVIGGAATWGMIVGNILSQADLAPYIQAVVTAWLDTQTTDGLAEGTTSQYFTNARAQAAFSVAVGSGLSLASGVFGIATGYAIPTTTQISNWNTAYGWGNHASAGYAAGNHNHNDTYEAKNSIIQGHISSTSNPHGVTATQVGLGNCDNTSDANKPISTAQGIALGNKADLVDGTIPANQLPSYVDDVLEYTNSTGFPPTGETGKIYVAKDTNLTYRWGGSGYVEISQSLAIGETSGTAYRGDRGKTAYDHSQASGNPHGATTDNISQGSTNQYFNGKTQDDLPDGATYKRYPLTDQTKLSGIEAGAVALSTVKADADIADAISKKHARQHALDSSSDHSAAAEADRGKFLRANPTTGAAELVDDPTTLPGGANQEIQFNQNGSFAGIPYFRYLSSVGNLGIGTFPEQLDAYTSLLLHFEGGTLVDSSPYANPLNIEGDLRLTTSQYQFGAQSIYSSDGGKIQGDYKSYYYMGDGTWTLDFWVRVGSFFDADLITRFSGMGNGLRIINSTSFGVNWSQIVNVPEMAIDTWYHVALVSIAGSGAFYLNGVNRGTFNATGWTGTSEIKFCGYSGAYFDEFRFSKGVARWTADFTPPTAAYSAELAIQEALHIGDTSPNSPPAFKISNDAQGFRTVVDGADGDKFKLQDTTDSNANIFTVEPGTQVMTFGAMPMTPSSAPNADYQTANKKYVDDQLGARLHAPVTSDPDGSLEGTAGMMVVWMDSGTPKLRVCTGGTSWAAPS